MTYRMVIKTKMMKKFLSTVFLFALLFYGFAQDNFPKPKPNTLVHDYVDLLNNQEQMALDNKLINFNDTTSNEIAIAIVNDIGGDDIDFYAAGLGEKWGIGKEKYENGILVLLLYTGVPGQNKVAIAIGKGLEGAIPDITAKRIVENELIPEFKMGNYFNGLDKATTVLMQMAAKEITSKEYMRQTGAGGLVGVGIFLLIFVMIIFVRFSSARQYSRSNSIPFWTALWLSNSMGSSRGSFSSFSSGSGSFGGFGGGSFGGGGASGSW